MKGVLLIVAVLVAAYYYFLMSTANVMLGATGQLQQQYSTVDQRVHQIAAGATGPGLR